MRATRVVLASFLGFAALEGSIFHSGLYTSILKPDSSTGVMVTFLDNELRRKRDGPNQVLAIGNSRMGLMPRIANELTPETGYTFATIAVAGTSPRIWHYMLREVDPEADRYAAIVIALDSYDDAETWEDFADRTLDNRFLAPLLRLSDAREYAASFRTPRYQWEALRGILFRGSVYTADFQDLLLHPAARLASVEKSRLESYRWFYDYVGTADSMEGVSIDWATRTMTVPPNRTLEQKKAYEIILLNPFPPEGGRHAAYMRTWLEKIYGRYRGSRTRLIFVRLPRGPLVRPDFPPSNPHSPVRDLAMRPEVKLIPEHFFDSLEQPMLFVDEIHLNQPGADRFSRMLAREVKEILEPAR